MLLFFIYVSVCTLYQKGVYLFHINTNYLPSPIASVSRIWDLSWIFV